MNARHLLAGPCVALALTLAGGAAAQDPVHFDNAADEQRYRRLVAELRCLVCQNQTLAESNAPLAVDLREQVRARIVAGESDAEVLTYLTVRYGDFVLYRPRFSALTAVLWLAPVLLLLGGGLYAWRLIRVRPEVATVSEDERAQVRALLEDRDT